MSGGQAASTLGLGCEAASNHSSLRRMLNRQVQGKGLVILSGLMWFDPFFYVFMSVFLVVRVLQDIKELVHVHFRVLQSAQS